MNIIFDENSARSYYTNNMGSRWVIMDRNKNKRKHTFTTKSGEQVIRTAIFYEAFGNYAVICISYKGKKIKVFADTILN